MNGAKNDDTTLLQCDGKITIVSKYASRLTEEELHTLLDFYAYLIRGYK